MLTIPSVTVFWRKVGRDLQRSIAEVEQKEPWVWHQNEMPELYDGLAKILPDLADVNVGEKREDLAEKLINLLGKASFGFSIAALSYLEALYDHDHMKVRWCGLCIDWAMKNRDNEDQPYAGVIAKRIRLIANTQTSQRLLAGFLTLDDDNDEALQEEHDHARNE